MLTTLSPSLPRLLRGRLLAAGVPTEHPRRRKLTHLVADHVLGHVQPHVHLAVVNQEGLTDELRDDGAVARPRLDRLAVASALLFLNLGEQPLIDIRPTFL